MKKSLKECGLSSKRIELLNKANITNSDELFSYYPFRYEKLENSKYSDWSIGDKVVVYGKLISYPTTFKYGYKKSEIRK